MRDRQMRDPGFGGSQMGQGLGLRLSEQLTADLGSSGPGLLWSQQGRAQEEWGSKESFLCVFRFPQCLGEQGLPPPPPPLPSLTSLKKKKNDPA